MLNNPKPFSYWVFLLLKLAATLAGLWVVFMLVLVLLFGALGGESEDRRRAIENHLREQEAYRQQPHLPRPAGTS